MQNYEIRALRITVFRISTFKHYGNLYCSSGANLFRQAEGGKEQNGRGRVLQSPPKFGENRGILNRLAGIMTEHYTEIQPGALHL
jgi:hypothetical protein